MHVLWQAAEELMQASASGGSLMDGGCGSCGEHHLALSGHQHMHAALVNQQP